MSGIKEHNLFAPFIALNFSLTLFLYFLLITPELACAQSSEGVILWSETDNPSSSDDDPWGVTIDASGTYIYVVGNESGSNKWRIEKRRADTGAPEWKTLLDHGGSSDSARKVVVDATGVYVCGFFTISGRELTWRTRKLDLNGNPVAGWDFITDHSAQKDIPRGIALDATGVYVVGSGWASSSDRLMHMEKRDLMTGNLDLLWGTNGKIDYNPSVGGLQHDYAIDVAVLDSGVNEGVYIVGQVTVGGISVWHAQKRNRMTGAIDWQRNYPSTAFAEALGVAVDATGMYIVGNNRDSGNDAWRIAKVSLSDGEPDWDVISNPSSGKDWVEQVALDSNYVYAIGYDEVYGDRRWRIEKREKVDGNLVWVQSLNPSSNNEHGKDIVLDPTIDPTVLYVVGYDDSLGNRQWHVQKRGWFVDIGLKIYDGTQNVAIGVEPAGVLNSPVRIGKDGTTYGVGLLETTNEKASKIRIGTPDGVRSLAPYE